MTKLETELTREDRLEELSPLLDRLTFTDGAFYVVDELSGEPVIELTFPSSETSTDASTLDRWAGDFRRYTNETFDLEPLASILGETFTMRELYEAYGVVSGDPVSRAAFRQRVIEKQITMASEEETNPAGWRTSPRQLYKYLSPDAHVQAIPASALREPGKHELPTDISITPSVKAVGDPRPYIEAVKQYIEGERSTMPSILTPTSAHLAKQALHSLAGKIKPDTKQASRYATVLGFIAENSADPEGAYMGLENFSLAALRDRLAQEREQPWRQNIPCVNKTDIFFPKPEKNTPHYRAEFNRLAAIAKTICESCVEKDRCLEFALTHREKDGIWGGTTPDERRAMTSPRRSKTQSTK